MKNYVVAVALLSVLPMVSAGAYQSDSRSGSSYYTRPVKTQKTTTRRSGGYTNTVTNNFYYQQQQPARRYESSASVSSYVSDDNVRYYDDNAGYYKGKTEYKSSKKQVSKKSYSSQTRKYFLAHPFFQPLEGKFGSVTDVSYGKNSFKFDMLNGSVLDIDPNSATYDTIVANGPVVPVLSAKQETSQFVVKEDFSYGISDTLAVIGLLQYDKTKVSVKDWNIGEPGDSTSNSGLNLFGIGLQNRFVDNDKWIAMVAGYFQHQKDTANTLIAELKAGYKINRTTLYGLGRFGYSDLIDGDIYGAFVDADDGDWLMLSYKTDVKDVIYAEAGAGAFVVLNKYFTLNGELIYGYYDWHNQLSIKGAIGWQPADSFALNLYASTALHDSGKGKTLKYMNYDHNPDVSDFPSDAQGTTLVYTYGDYKMKNYDEWKIGVQAIFYF